MQVFASEKIERGFIIGKIRSSSIAQRTHKMNYTIWHLVNDNRWTHQLFPFGKSRHYYAVYWFILFITDRNIHTMSFHFRITSKIRLVMNGRRIKPVSIYESHDVKINVNSPNETTRPIDHLLNIFLFIVSYFLFVEVVPSP